MGACTAPIPPLDWMEYCPPWGPMTRGVLRPCIFFFARRALVSCMGLERTRGPVLHNSPYPIINFLFLPRASLVDVQLPYAPRRRHPLGQPQPLLHPARVLGLPLNLLPPPLGHELLDFSKTPPPMSRA